MEECRAEAVALYRESFDFNEQALGGLTSFYSVVSNRDILKIFNVS